ncbi:MAG TPA: hypothetical protein VHU44_10320 [Acidobacteriaceae bacterium]|jgi:hypothetical protein|nr:hypothetical protein [Acidobacteriaceae bacterium]
MRRLLQLATAALLATTLMPSYAKPKNDKQREDVEWLWQYTPDDRNKDGRENDLVQDAHFRAFLEQFLTAPQTFWGVPINGKYKTLAETALDYLSVPEKVAADENRYISITGHVIRFAPARGLLWIDLNGKHHLVAFAAVDWTKQGRPTTDPTAEYTLWLFSNDPLTVEGPGSGAQHVPAALTKSIARWSAQPLPGSGIVENITHAVLVDPDGTPHEVPPASLGVRPVAKDSDEQQQAPTLAPRN